MQDPAGELGAFLRHDKSAVTTVMVTASGISLLPVKEMPVTVSRRRPPVLSYSSTTRGSSCARGEALAACDIARASAPTVGGVALPWFSHRSSHESPADQPGGAVLSSATNL